MVHIKKKKTLENENRTLSTLDTWQTAERASRYPGCVLVRR